MKSENNSTNDGKASASKDSGGKDSGNKDSAIKTILGLGEEGMSEVARQLLSNELFVSSVQKAITGGLSAKRTLDKGVSTVLGLVNVPTLDDVEKVRDRLVELEEAFAEIAQRVQSIDARLSANTDKERRK